MILRKRYLGTLYIAKASKSWDLRRVDGSSNFANEGIEIAPGPKLVSILTAKYPEGRYAKGAFRRRRNRTFVFSLNERRIMLPPSLHPRPSSPKDRKRTGARALQSSSAESSWVERSYHSHICKPTGRTVWKLQARDALSLVLSVRYGPRGDGKITGTKLVWPPSKGERCLEIQVQVRARGHGCEVHAVCVYTLLLKVRFTSGRFLG